MKTGHPLTSHCPLMMTSLLYIKCIKCKKKTEKKAFHNNEYMSKYYVDVSTFRNICDQCVSLVSLVKMDEFFLFIYLFMVISTL